jgi:hypothetical protein
MPQTSRNERKAGTLIAFLVLLFWFIVVFFTRRNRRHIPSPLTATEEPSSPVESRQQKASYLGEKVLTLVITGIIVAGMQAAFDKTLLGKQVAWAGYNIALSSLPARLSPVTIIDIDHISTREGRNQRDLTDRQQLDALVAALVEYAPRAIVVDIDMTVDYVTDEYNRLVPKWRDEYDSAFYRRCATLPQTRGIPVIFAMERGLNDVEQQYFKDRAYAKMAGNVRILSEVESQMNLWIQDRYGRRVPSLAYATTCAILHHGIRLKAWEQALLTVTQQVPLDAIQKETPRTACAYHVYYANVDQFVRQRIHALTPQGAIDEARLRAAATRLRGGILIIGEANPNTRRDQYYAIPGRTVGQVREMPGIYLHASAIDTLLHGRPVALPNGWGNFLFSLIQSLFVALLITGMSCIGHARALPSRTEDILTLLFTLAIFVGSLYLCASASIVWNGGLASVVFLPVEYAVSSGIAWVYAVVATHSEGV